MIIISDIHGCLRTLIALLDKLPTNDTIVFGGDLVDRGPDSAGVVRFAMENKILTVMGNHDHMMLDALTGGGAYDKWAWAWNGGEGTMRSFKGDVPDEVVAWLGALPDYLIFDDLLISHTGHAYGADCRSTGLWARGFVFPNDGYFRVFGHTPVKKPVITGTYAAIDTGCAYPAGHKLTAFQYPSMRTWQQGNLETHKDSNP